MQPNDAAMLARRLMDQHGLKAWSFAFDNAKTRAGVCRASTQVIGLSRPLTLLHDEAEVRDTVLHEIAHALVGPERGHDKVWRTMAQAIGCSGERCLTSVNGRIDAAWVGTCPAGHTTTRHRRPERVQSCAQCAPRFDPTALWEWTFHGRPVEMPAAYQAELEALRTPPSPIRTVAARTSPTAPVVTRPILPIGTQVRLLGAGPYGGLVGAVVKRGRTRYHVRTPMGIVTAPVLLVRPL